MKLFNLKFALLLFGAMFFLASCGDDPIEPGGGTGTGGGGTTQGDPSLSLIDDDGYISSDVTVAPNSVLLFKLDATKGDAEINTLEVLLDGTATTAYQYNGTDAEATPKLLVGNARDGFVWEIALRALSSEDTETITFQITDDAGNTASKSVSITTQVGGGGTGGTEPPVVSVFGSETVTGAAASSPFNIKFSATPASGVLSSITVYEDGNVISDLGRLKFDGNSVDANPYSLPEAYQAGFTDINLTVTTQSTGSSAYRVVVTDSEGNSSEFTKTISVGGGGTAVTTLTGVLLNQAGPAGQGGLDLDTGNGNINSDDASAEIRDQGIDQTQSDANNWIQRIAGVNGSTLKALVPGQNGALEGLSFASVTSQEAITDLHNNNGITLASGQSNVVLVNDMFTVENNGKYYLLVVTDVNVTSSDNGDSYTFSIKK